MIINIFQFAIIHIHTILFLAITENVSLLNLKYDNN